MTTPGLKNAPVDIEELLQKMSTISREVKFLRENDEVLRARIDSLISVNDKLTKSLKRKVNLSKKRKLRTNENKTEELHDISKEEVEDETQLSITPSNNE